jgi:hypothetical protein
MESLGHDFGANAVAWQHGDLECPPRRSVGISGRSRRQPESRMSMVVQHVVNRAGQTFLPANEN